MQSTGNPRFPYRLSIVKEDRPLLVLYTQDKWPGTKGNIFCIRETEPPEDDGLFEEVECVPIISFRRMGKRADVVLDRPNRKRCDFLFLTKRYKNKEGSYEQIFFRTQAASSAHKSSTRRELFGDPGLNIIIDSGERYAWSFSNAKVRKEKLPVGDYSLIIDEQYAALVERKTFDNMLSDLSKLRVLHQQLSELSGYRNAAMVIEAQYGDFLNTKKVNGRWPITHIAKVIAEIAALHPRLQMIFAGNRKMVNQWCKGYFTAVANAFGRRKTEDELPFAGEIRPEYSTPRREEMLIRKALLEELPSRFSIGDLRQEFPQTADSKLRLVLKKLREQGRFRCEGGGQAARWVRIG